MPVKHHLLGLLTVLAGPSLAHPAQGQGDVSPRQLLNVPLDVNLQLDKSSSGASQQCDHDKLYSLFHQSDHTSKASSWCTSYLPRSTATSTVTVVVHPTTVSAKTTTVTPTTVYKTVTKSSTITKTTTVVTYTTIIVPATTTVSTTTNVFTATNPTTVTGVTSFLTATSFTQITAVVDTSTSVETDLATTTITPAVPVKRHTTNTPDWLSSAVKSYSPSSLSSACSCLITPKPTTKTVTVTKTGSPIVKTSLATTVTTAQRTKTTAVTETDTVTAVKTRTTVSTSTTSVVATAGGTTTVVQTVTATATAVTTVTITQTVSVTSIVPTTTTATITATAVTPTPSSTICGYYTTANGEDFEEFCNTNYPVNSPIVVLEDPSSTFFDCIDECSLEPDCVGVNFITATGECTLFADYDDTSVTAAQGLMAAIMVS